MLVSLTGSWRAVFPLAAATTNCTVVLAALFVLRPARASLHRAVLAGASSPGRG
jgi:hypothetical protein